MHKMTDITLIPLENDGREQFILDNQEAFNYGALEEFGRKDDHFEEDGQIISRETIEQSIENGEAYRIMQGEKKVGGVVIKVDGERGDLELLFVSPKVHSKGIGYAAWCAIEKLHPEVKIRQTVRLGSARSPHSCFRIFMAEKCTEFHWKTGTFTVSTMSAAVSLT